MDLQVNKELIFDHLSGNATMQQRILINKWLENPQNEEQFYKYVYDWELTKPQYEVDTVNALEKFRQSVQCNFSNEVETVLTSTSNIYKKMLSVAACILFAIGIGWIYQDEIKFKTLTSAPGQIKTFNLDDGSIVTLNANSDLRYDRWKFNRTERVVILRGEAEFKVKHQKDNQQFMVKTGNKLNIVVLGTVFSVYNRHKKMQVTLNEGSVRIEQKLGVHSKNWIMIPGDIVTVEKTGKTAQKQIESIKQYAPWKESRLEFDKSTLNDIAQILEDNYNLKVNIDGKFLADMTISGSFKAHDAQELLDSVTQILDIKYTIQKDTVRFYY